ncbi:MAG: chorismate synthase [Muribaculaceae bacterium]|nr:chorismate synthase [Muribaculaceae bacterium]
MSNTFGTIFRLTSFGESHGPAIGGVIDGVPAGVSIDMAQLQRFVARRRPGQSSIATSRNECDEVEFLSGIYNGVTLGTPIGFVIRNNDQRSADYDLLARCYRPSHADYTYEAKYGLRDPRGGGRASARETAARVVAGALAMQLLEKLGVSVTAYTSQVGNVKLETGYSRLDLSSIDNNPVRCPDAEVASRMQAEIEAARLEGNTLGGMVSCVATGVPAGCGEPVFGKLHAQLGAALLSINAAKAFELGTGMRFASARGSEVMDTFVCKNGVIGTQTNHSGGVQGGISNGEDIYFNVVFKPVATLMRPVETIDREGRQVTLPPRGRHDPCVVPRAVPIVEAMTAMVLLDNYLLHKTNHL